MCKVQVEQLHLARRIHFLFYYFIFIVGIEDSVFVHSYHACDFSEWSDWMFEIISKILWVREWMALPDRRFMLSIVVIAKELYWVSDGNTPTPNLFLIFAAMPHVVPVTCDHRISEFVSFQSYRISSILLTLEVKNQRLTTAYSATDDDKLRANIDTAVNRHSKLSGEDGNDSHFLLFLLLHVLKWIRLFLSVSRLLLTTAVCVVRVRIGVRF